MKSAVDFVKQDGIGQAGLKSTSILQKVAKLKSLKWLLVLIPLAYTILLLYYSIFSVLKLSIYGENGFTLQYISEVLTDPIYIKVLWITIKTAAIVTVTTLFIAYPLAYLAAIAGGKWKSSILGIIMVSFWISLLVRTFTWLVILRDHGVINEFLMYLGIIDKPIQLVYNFTGVVIGMTHILLPYMVLCLYSVMDGIDRNVIQAAHGLGARPLKTFAQIFLPLSLPGVLSGALIVFVLGLGYFVTPMLIGGPDNTMISELIQQNIQTTLNWERASALSILLLVTTLILLSIASLFARNLSVLKEDK
ncbi:ABC transporter permease [Neobacillus sp. 19]|uniref:ABC transporter permease n=1 Tax=Neobacillus sp. 19 TaxID=3394458 RepID=UPI003BF6D570